MKLKTLFLFLAFVCSGVLLAEDYKVELFDVKTVQTADSVMVTSTLQVNMEEMPTRNQLRFTPVLVVDGKNTDFGPVVLLNGKKQHHIYKCKVILDQRKSSMDDKNDEMAYEFKGGEIRVAFHSAVALDKKKSGEAKLFFRHEMIDSYGDVISTKMQPIENSLISSDKSNRSSTSNRRNIGSAKVNDGTTGTFKNQQKTAGVIGTYQGPQHSFNSNNESNHPGTLEVNTGNQQISSKPSDSFKTTKETTVPPVNEIVQLKQDFNVLYKGSYLQPAEDAIFQRNQKELRFSLEEAKVIAEINPNMLSLRELFAVAQGYTERSAMFHKIIKISVDLYPSNPIANLNAAASAIELGDIESAANYLQVAPHDTLAYTNCRGAYELMRNNVQEGLRLLKAASAAGSKEADDNLKIFFGSFKK